MKLASLAFIGAVSLMPGELAALAPAAAWEIGPWVRGRNYSTGMPAHPTPDSNGSVSFDFPTTGRGQVDAMTMAIGPLQGGREITLRYRIESARGTQFLADEMPNEPATVSLYFQQSGDNWSGRGPFASYRWYSPTRAVVPLQPGMHSVTVRLDEVWTNVRGWPNTQLPREYDAALRNTARIGLAFGSLSRRSHGVYATGRARFTLISFEVR